MMNYEFFRSRRSSTQEAWVTIIRGDTLLPEFDRYTTDKSRRFAEVRRIRRFVHAVDQDLVGDAAFLGHDLEDFCEYEVACPTLLFSADLLTASAIIEADLAGFCTAHGKLREYVSISEVQTNGTLLQLYLDEGSGATGRALQFVTDSMRMGPYRSAYRKC